MRKLILLFLFIAFVSCDKPYAKKPADLLSKSEMVDVLTDLYINQQAVTFHPIQSYSTVMAENSLFILKKHEISEKQFQNSYKYYYTSPEEYQKILDKVKSNLEDKLSEKEKKRQAELKAEHGQATTELEAVR